MVLKFSCDRELPGFFPSSQAADLSHYPSELCDQVFQSITSNIHLCDYLNLSDGVLKN